MPVNNKNVKILQWNIRSLKTNWLDLMGKLQFFKPTIVALSETFMKQDFKINVNQYTIIREDRDDVRGGIAFLIKNNIKYEVITVNINNKPSRMQCQAIRVDKLALVHIYNPPDITLKTGIMYQIISQIGDQFLIIGDLNAQSPQWGSGNINTNGKILEDLLEALDLILLNDGSITRYTPSHQKEVPLM